MAKKHLTNVQVVKNIMEYSKYGALAQAFVIQALEKYSEAVSKASPEEVNTPFGETWVGVAKEIHQKLQEHYNQ